MIPQNDSGAVLSFLLDICKILKNPARFLSNRIRFKSMRTRKGSFMLPLMFIGLGLGMLLNNTGAFLFLGMGLGFLLDGIFPPKKKAVLPRDFGANSTVDAILGIFFMAIGLTHLINPALLEVIWKNFTAFIFIVLGVYFLLKSTENAR